MPYRQTIFESGCYYHTYSRGINKQIIFHDDHDYRHSLGLIRYYSFSQKKIRYSRFRALTDLLKTKILNSLTSSDKLVEIISFCLMPNHFHFLLKQNKENGISKFMADFQNSYIKFFNTKYHKFGSILQTPFKAELVESDTYLLHLSRYIHLNPYTAELVNSQNDLENYQWSSLPEYLHQSKTPLINSQVILENFKNLDDFRKFTFDQADLQRELKQTKKSSI